MAGLESGIFYIESKSLEECDWHKTRLSLNFNLDHQQRFVVDRQEHFVSPKQYLLIDEGQSFKTSLRADSQSRMVTLAYKIGVPEDLYYSISHDHEYLLDNPKRSQNSLFLFDQVLPVDTFLGTSIEWLCAQSATLSERQVQETLQEVLEHVLAQQIPIQKRITAIEKVKASTRQEIYRRLHWTLEFINDNFTSPITLDQLADHACLSVFHFKRLFKEVYQVPPYQYIKAKRIERAKAFLQMGYSVENACKACGWEDPSSFIRLFRKTTSITPKQFKVLQGSVATGS